MRFAISHDRKYICNGNHNTNTMNGFFFLSNLSVVVVHINIDCFAFSFFLSHDHTQQIKNNNIENPHPATLIKKINKRREMRMTNRWKYHS